MLWHDRLLVALNWRIEPNLESKAVELVFNFPLRRLNRPCCIDESFLFTFADIEAGGVLNARILHEKVNTFVDSELTQEHLWLLREGLKVACVEKRVPFEYSNFSWKPLLRGQPLVLFS